MSLARAPRAVTIARVDATEIAFHWRWLPVLALGTVLLAHSVLPVRFPAWEPSTTWLTSLAAIVAGEAALLLHELSHAFVARGRGHEVQRIVFHGFTAETVIGDGQPTPGHEALIALVGPATNLLLAGLAAALRATLAPTGPVDVVLVLLLGGNLAAASMSLLPIGGSDGSRALRAIRRLAGIPLAH